MQQSVDAEPLRSVDVKGELPSVMQKQQLDRIANFDDSRAWVTCCGRVLWEAPWRDVVEVAAWKEDLFGYDAICLGLRTAESGEAFSWSWEEDHGFEALMKEVESRFPPMDEHWWTKVAFPAFERNFTVVWRRGDCAPRGHLP